MFGKCDQKKIKIFEKCRITHFHLKLFEWNAECPVSLLSTSMVADGNDASDQLTVLFSSAVMGGAIFGAFLFGFLADNIGRKPTVIGLFVFHFFVQIVALFL